MAYKILTVRADEEDINKIRKLLNTIKKKTGQAHRYILIEALDKLKKWSV